MTPLAHDQVTTLLARVPAWKMSSDGSRIRRDWLVKDFVAGLEFFRRVGELAEAEGHHPDLHLVSYRQLAVELWTHDAGGLTENDFIMAAKIDEVPIVLRDVKEART